jgi:hypothetical protein
MYIIITSIWLAKKHLKKNIIFPSKVVRPYVNGFQSLKCYPFQDSHHTMDYLRCEDLWSQISDVLDDKIAIWFPIAKVLSFSCRVIISLICTTQPKGRRWSLWILRLNGQRSSVMDDEIAKWWLASKVLSFSLRFTISLLWTPTDFGIKRSNVLDNEIAKCFPGYEVLSSSPSKNMSLVWTIHGVKMILLNLGSKGQRSRVLDNEFQLGSPYNAYGLPMGRRWYPPTLGVKGQECWTMK